MIETALRICFGLAHPVGIVWLLLTFWLVISIFGRRRFALLPALAWIVLTLTTCTPLASWVLADLESQYPPIKIESLPQADAILCLGGGAEPSFTEATGVHLKTGSDRILTALLLAARKKAGTLVLGGGGYVQGKERISEADALAAHLKGHPAAPLPIVSLGLCWHTHDEALKYAELAKERGWKSVLLVTSASHMPRAVGIFNKLGIKVAPVPCNYQSSFNRVGEVEWLHLPHDHNFSVFSVWFHELIGTWVYRYRGWL